MNKKAYEALKPYMDKVQNLNTSIELYPFERDEAVYFAKVDFATFNEKVSTPLPYKTLDGIQSNKIETYTQARVLTEGNSQQFFIPKDTEFYGIALVAKSKSPMYLICEPDSDEVYLMYMRLYKTKDNPYIPCKVKYRRGIFTEEDYTRAKELELKQEQDAENQANQIQVQVQIS